MRFSREFVAFTLEFAQHVQRIKGLPLDEALLHFTHLYLSFGLPRDFDRLNPVWRAFVAGFTSPRDLVEWTYTFYLQQQTRVRADAVPIDPAFGCFSYVVWPHNRVRLHFQNVETPDHSALSRVHHRQRLAELAAMFRHLRDLLPSNATVVGGSWLYNIEAYRRLFPLAFLATAQVGANEYQFMAQWGQFLDRHGQIKPTIAGSFLDQIARRATGDSLEDCFPYPVLRLEAPIGPFYEFYGLA